MCCDCIKLYHQDPIIWRHCFFTSFLSLVYVQSMHTVLLARNISFLLFYQNKVPLLNCVRLAEVSCVLHLYRCIDNTMNCEITSIFYLWQKINFTWVIGCHLLIILLCVVCYSLRKLHLSGVNLSGLTNAYHSMYASINLERKRTDRQLDNYISACAKLKVHIKENIL